MFVSAWHQQAKDFLRSSATLSNLIGLVGGMLALFLLCAFPAPWNLRLPCYLALMVWILLRPRVALYLLPIAIPWGSLDSINVAGLHLNSADILVVFFVISWLMSFVLPVHKFRASTNLNLTDEIGPCDRATLDVPPYLLWAICTLIGMMILSLLGAHSISLGLKEISKWLEFLVLILIGTQYVRTRRQLWTIIILICLGGITQAFFGYAQAIFNLGPAAFLRNDSLRVYGTFDQPNPYAGYLNIPLSIAAALCLLGRNGMTRVLAGCTTLFIGIALFLSQSRGAELAITVALLFIVIVGISHIRLVFRFLLVAGPSVIAVFLSGLIPEYVFTPMLKLLGLVNISFTAPSMEDFSTAERLAHWIAGVHMFYDHPLLGVGIGNYPAAYSHYIVAIFTNSLGHAHNYYINIAAETGFFGLTAYLFFLTAIFVAGGYTYRVVNQQYRALVIGILAALISICVHNIFDDLYVHDLVLLMALLLIILIRLENRMPTQHTYGG